MYDHKVLAAFSFHDKHTINAHLQISYSENGLSWFKHHKELSAKEEDTLTSTLN